jgi:hypothetical protein
MMPRANRSNVLLDLRAGNAMASVLGIVGNAFLNIQVLPLAFRNEAQTDNK